MPFSSLVGAFFQHRSCRFQAFLVWDTRVLKMVGAAKCRENNCVAHSFKALCIYIDIRQPDLHFEKKID